MTTIESTESIIHAPWWPELLSLAGRLTVEELSRRFGVDAATVEEALEQVGLVERDPDHRTASLRILAGSAPDADVAARVGVTPDAVKTFRRDAGIGPFLKPPPRSSSARPPGRSRAQVVESVAPETSPASAPGRVLRRREGTVEEVRAATVALSPAAPARPPAPTKPASSPLAALRERMGTVSDDVIAGLAGVSRAMVRSFRVKHGISAYDGFRSRKRERRAATGRKTEGPKAKPGRVSKVDPFLHLLGEVPDSEVATLAGVTRANVTAYRYRRGIPMKRQRASSVTRPTLRAVPAPSSERRESATATVAPAPPKPAISPLDAVRERMGTVSDDVIAGLAGVSRAVVRSYRVKHGIPAYDGFRSRKRVRRVVPGRKLAGPKAKRGRVSRVDPFLHLLGEVPDGEVATLAGVTPANVTAYRRRKGIPMNVQSASSEMRPTLPAVPALRASRSAERAETVVAPPFAPSSDAPPRPLRESGSATVAFTVIAVRRSEFVTTGSTVADAAVRAQSLLDARDDGPWEVLEVKWLGSALS